MHLTTADNPPTSTVQPPEVCGKILWVSPVGFTVCASFPQQVWFGPWCHLHCFLGPLRRFGGFCVGVGPGSERSVGLRVNRATWSAAVVELLLEVKVYTIQADPCSDNPPKHSRNPKSNMSF